MVTDTRLPLLDYAASLTPNVSLKRALLITCQHILESNGILLDYLLELGLEPKNTFLLGKCYSTNNEVAKELTDKGIYVHPASMEFDSHIAFDDHHAQAARDLFGYVKNEVDIESFEKIIIIDEGGQLIVEAHHQLDDFSKIRAVEWTSSGYDILRRQELLFPVINMARSEAKLHLESPMIADLIVQKFQEYISDATVSAKHILVIGGGYIGSNIAEALSKDFWVQRFDIVSDKSDLVGKELETILGNFDVIIGSTGRTSIPSTLHSKLKQDTVLLSASSSDREFESAALRKRVARTTNPHDNLIVDGIHVVNCGFPVTFDGTKQLIPLEKIQLTDALAYSSAIQAATTLAGPGIQSLDEDTQQRLINQFTNLSKAS